MSRQTATQTLKQEPAAAPITSELLQRTCACGNHTMAGGECAECSKTKLFGLQTKLQVNEPGDVYEQEADRVADQVMRMPEHGLQRQADDEEDEGLLQSKPLVQRKSFAAQAREAEPPASVHEVLRSPGQPLGTAERQFFERRFGHDFSHVRVHTNVLAGESAQAVHARAYTVGRNIAFAEGQYSPATAEGKRLLAHELTHVVQQGGGESIGSNSERVNRGSSLNNTRDSNLIQRAEVDDRSCAGLTDIKSDIDTEVNAGISAERSAAASPMVVADFLQAVSRRLGGRFVGAIETFIQNMATTKRTDPAQDLLNTKFKGVSGVNRFYLLHTVGAAKVVGPAAKVNGLCVGADKFGHFFGEGFIYFTVAKGPGGRAAGTARAESTGRFLEISDKQGLGVTGVYSNADLAANLAGKRFYEDLEADPTGFTFSVANYVTNKWNETINPSFYASSEAKVIWSNLLTGLWNGEFTSGGGSSAPIRAKVDLVATTTGSVTGTNSWPAHATKPRKEKIKNGKITEKTTSVSGTFPVSPAQTLSETPVSGVTIEFDWELGKRKGKGEWTSVDEQNLVGTWGIGSSRTSGGTWKLKKI